MDKMEKIIEKIFEKVESKKDFKKAFSKLTKTKGIKWKKIYHLIREYECEQEEDILDKPPTKEEAGYYCEYCNKSLEFKEKCSCWNRDWEWDKEFYNINICYTFLIPDYKIMNKTINSFAANYHDMTYEEAWVNILSELNSEDEWNKYPTREFYFETTL